MMREHEKIDTFLDEVCSQVKAREIHQDIRREIGNHLEELIAQKETGGYTPEEAASWAIQQMGDPDVLGKGLHQVHKPRIYWGLLLTVLFFSMMSLFAMWSVDVGYQKTALSLVNFTKHQFIFVILGIVLMLGLYFWDFRKLKDYSWLLYLITVGGIVATTLFGVSVNGTKHYFSIGPIQIDWIGNSPYLLITAIAGILMNSSIRKIEGRKNNRLLEFLLLVVPGVIYAVVHAMPELIMYVMVSLVLIGWLTHRWLLISLIAVGLFFTGIVYAWNSPYLWNRLTAAITPFNDPSDAGYMYLQRAAVIRSSGWWGNGFGANQTRLPSIHSEMLLTYMINCFGWAAGLVLMSAVIWFLTRLAYAVKAVREPYGRTLILVLSMMLAIPLVYGLAMTTGLVLLINLPFPFLSYGGSHLLIEYAVVGLLLGIYSRKDIIPLHKQAIVDKER